MPSNTGNEYRRKSTILGDNDIYDWVREQEDKRKDRERKEKTYIADKIPQSVKSKPLSGVEQEQFNRGMSLLTIWKRRMNDES